MGATRGVRSAEQSGDGLLDDGVEKCEQATCSTRSRGSCLFVCCCSKSKRQLSGGVPGARWLGDAQVLQGPSG